MGQYASGVTNYTNALQVLTKEYIEPDSIVDQVYETSPFFALMRATGHLIEQKGGLFIGQAINIAKGPNFSWYSGSGGWKMTTVEGQIELGWDWKLAHDGVVVTGEELVKNEDSTVAIANLIQTKIDVASLNAPDNVSLDIFNNNPTGTNADNTAGNPQSLEGLVVQVDDGTFSTNVGQQSRTTYTTLKAKVNYNSTLASLIANVQTLWLAANRGGRSRTRVNFTTEAIYGAFWGLLQTPERYVLDPTRMEAIGLKTTGGNDLAFNDAPVLLDEKIATGVPKPVNNGGSGGYWYGLNTDFFNLYVHPQRFFSLGEWYRDPNGDAYFMDIYFAGAFCCKRPNKQFVLWISGG